MTALFLFVLLFVSPTAAASHPWSALEGCYRTISHNGEAVGKPSIDRGSIKIGEARSMRDLRGRKIPALNFIVFQGFGDDERVMYFDYIAVFPELGQYTSDAEGEHYKFAGELTYEFGKQVGQFTLEEEISVKHLGEGRIALTTHEHFENLPDGTHDNRHAYVLEKKECTKQ